MSSRLNPYISFRDNARQAMEFYTDVFGGAISVPLEKQMWGDEFGMCVDKFGVGWMVNITPAQA